MSVFYDAWIFTNAVTSTVLAHDVNLVQGIFIEMFITAALVLSVLVLGAKEHPATQFAPVRSIYWCHFHGECYLIVSSLRLSLV